MAKRFVVFALGLLAACGAGCSEPTDEATPVATPQVTMSRTAAAIGRPLDMQWSFSVAADAPPFVEDFYVFVHFIGDTGELMWTDDHRPPTPTSQWKPGATIAYTRTVFVPKFPYTGNVSVHAGLYSPSSNTRVPLAGDGTGGRAYRVAGFQMTPEADTVFVVYTDGWHQAEVAGDSGGVEWQWSKKRGTVAFHNPKRDVTVMIQADLPVPALTDPVQVDVSLGATVVDSFGLAPGGELVRRVSLSAAQLGDGETVELALTADRTFVPSTIPALRSRDSRELGIRVFRVYIEPK